MDINSAVKLFNAKYPNRKVFGYWVNGSDFVLNSFPLVYHGVVEPGQYVVTSSGKIYGTNPLNSDLSSKMTLL